jgi:hypothetical protein
MNAVCPVCGVVFEKESGYFIGAMIASYFIGTFLALPVLLALVFLYDIEMPIALTVIMVQILLMQPLIFRFSRILWIRIEAKLTQAILNQNH